MYISNAGRWYEKTQTRDRAGRLTKVAPRDILRSELVEVFTITLRNEEKRDSTATFTWVFGRRSTSEVFTLLLLEVPETAESAVLAYWNSNRQTPESMERANIAY